MQKQREIELLAPAKNIEIAKIAIDHGADAVYIGASSHGARSAAANTVKDIAAIVEYAHQFNARIYCALNTIIYDNELVQVEKLIHQLYKANVDALIVQDMGILRMDIPPIALHASTQCDIRNAAKAKFLEEVGFSQLVLARELSINEIKTVYQAVNIPLEVFVHGALCVSYSGDCQASMFFKNRSANRGECAQICRLPYKLTNKHGEEIPIASGPHLLSLKDMNRSAYINRLLEAGASSFKIEGRLKDANYVKNTVAAYRTIIDNIISLHPDRYKRASFGEIDTSFNPDLAKSFNRGYTDYFMEGRTQSKNASFASPKSVGHTIGTVLSSQKNKIKVNLTHKLNNGDGLGFYSSNGEFIGFRLNRIDGEFLFPASPILIPTGTTLFRNKDKAWDDLLNNSTATRLIPIHITLRWATNSLISADVESFESHIRISTTLEIEKLPAKTPQEENRASNMSRFGGTSYKLESLTDNLGNHFIPSSKISELRRMITDRLDKIIKINHRYGYRPAEKMHANNLPTKKLTYHDNISNHKASQFYSSHGAFSISPAIEIKKPDSSQTKVMTTRHCIRRELGCCLKTENKSNLPDELFIENGFIKMSLKFDCKLCEMQVWST